MQTLASNLSLTELVRLVDQTDNKLAQRIISLIADGDGLSSQPLATALCEAYTTVETFLENLETTARDEWLEQDSIENKIKNILSDFHIDKEKELQTAIEKMIDDERQFIKKSLQEIWINELLDSKQQRDLKNELQTAFDNINSADLPDSWEFKKPF
jgi:hypothetical protein